MTNNFGICLNYIDVCTIFIFTETVYKQYNKVLGPKNKKQKKIRFFIYHFYLNGKYSHTYIHIKLTIVYIDVHNFNIKYYNIC